MEADEYYIEPESLEMAVEFAQRYSRLLLNKKNIGTDIKNLKKEFNERGLPTNIVVKAVTKMKNDKKEQRRNEIDAFKEHISKNAELAELISQLISKD